ncbi:autotransporter family protein [Bosea spartocytisi]|jgi:fibronectin-binding autotransporter adhesin|uniref:autotransporter family protein n=1 Tax=Bosea spartocytisi TaxID=2773451 RepID=UPI0020BE726D|nr:autotransporter outer membrane beta-barrel domain-containing protein [Bosea spartocytisi]MCT4473742.1 autotransporter outer membrane beta-barrel domain-containing protein [Bosea spartocytisi]
MKSVAAARDCRQALLLSTALVALVCATGLPARAQMVTGNNDLNPNLGPSPSWTITGDLVVGQSSVGSLSIMNGGAVTNDYGTIGDGAGGDGSVTVSGVGSNGTASTWTNAFDLYVGYDGAGTLSILNGGTVSNLAGYIGANPGSQGTVTVSGVNSNGTASTWTNASDLYVGYSGSGTLNILAGGRVSNAAGNVGGGSSALISGLGSSWQNTGRLAVGQYGTVGSTGTLRAEGGATISSADGVIGSDTRGDAVLTGVGTTWTTIGQFTVGSFGPGTLRIEDGASVISNQGYIGANDTGTVTVTGAGSKWVMSPFNLTIGNFGAGSLTVENGGLVRAEGGVLLGVNAGVSGTLLVQGLASNRGVLETGGIRGGSGIASVTFDGGLLRATRNNSTFFNNFDTRTIAIGANGLVIDTDGHDIGISPTFTGAGALIKDGLGKLELTGNSGATYTGAGSVLAGTLAVNGVLGGTMEVIGGRLQGIGTVGSTINQPGGTIAPGNSIGTLTINGNYVGNGGRLEIETVLGGDASPSDRLVITGSTAGSTLVTVLNQGGAGAQTIEGIKVVDVGGASNGVFTLQGNYVFQGQPAVVAGAYAYTLQKNGISTPNDGDWYLRSAYLTPPPTSPPPTSPPPTSPSTGPTEIGPIYQPGAPIYEAYGQVLQSLNELQTLRQRVGERFDGRPDDTANAAGRAIWARIDAAHSRVTPGFSTTGTSYAIDSWRLQAGADGQVFAGDAGTLVGGVTLHHGEALADISSVFGRGKIKASGTGFGGALTWYGASGFYADAQTKLNWFDSDLSSTTAGRQLAKGKGGFGYALGLEIGQRIALSGAWSLTPQAQLTYSHVDADSFVDPFGARVALGDGDSLRGRLGISADYRQSWRDSAGRQVNASLYGIANLHYEFLDGTTVTVAGTPLTSRGQRLWGGLGLGAKYETGRYALYGEVEAQTSLAHFADSHSITGRAGLRVSW